MAKILECLEGTIERIVYVNEENNYTVARLKTDEVKAPVTIVGNLVGINPGETLKVVGKWVFHKKFGQQFTVSNYRPTVPATLNGIEKYLSSGLIKGIGPVMAKRLVNKFGLITLDVIEGNSHRLAEVDGIGPKRISMIKKAWEEQREVRDVMLFLQSHGVSAGYAAKIYKKYAHQSIERVSKNPYCLASDIFGIGFKTADRIAQNLGIEPGSQMRAEAGIIYSLNELSAEGHVFAPLSVLLDRCQKILDISPEIIPAALSKLKEEKSVIVENIQNGSDKTEEDQQAIYLPFLYIAETSIAKILKTLNNFPSNLTINSPERDLEWVQTKLKLNLAENQKKAVIGALTHKVMMVTGGPGTGKTTIVKAIIEILRQNQSKVQLAAPTGRAAKRLSETTGMEAKTLHRLLEYSAKERGFLRNQKKTLSLDVLIVDEASMIDTLLFYHLLKAMPLHAVLILVGDIYQLPSVGPGNILKDILESGIFSVIELTEIFRQAKESLIVTNAHRINRGEFPLFGKSTGTGPSYLADFYFVKEDDPQKVLNLLLEFVKSRIPYKFGFDARADIQILTPMNRGLLGTLNLNGELQNLLNPNSKELSRGGKLFRLNDKVMQIKNNYEKEVFNGDIGRIIKIDLENQEVSVIFDSGRVIYQFQELDELVLAYAVSVHKSQGSEYPVIILPLLTQHFILLQRNLLYTAVTRAKKLVVIIGSVKALAIALKNNKTLHRYTNLKYYLLENSL